MLEPWQNRPKPPPTLWETPRAGHKWEKEEMIQVRDAWRAGLPLTSIARSHERSCGAIQGKLIEIFGEHYERYHNQGNPEPAAYRTPDGNATLQNLRAQLVCANEARITMLQRHAKELAAVQTKIDTLMEQIGEEVNEPILQPMGDPYDD